MIVECTECHVRFEVTEGSDGSRTYQVVPSFRGVLSLVCPVRSGAASDRHPPCPHEKRAVGLALRRMPEA